MASVITKETNFQYAYYRNKANVPFPLRKTMGSLSHQLIAIRLTTLKMRQSG